MRECACCGNLTISDYDYDEYEICGICGWVDDSDQNANPTDEDGANDICLEEYKKQCESFLHIE